MKTRYGYGEKIFTADDLAKERGFKNNGEMLKHDIKDKSLLENSVDTKNPVNAIINHSRLLVICDVCGNAMAVNSNETFFCMNCLNYKNKNKPRPIIIPKNLDEIESLLLKRPLPKQRNWTKEKTADLISENKLIGK